MNGKMIIENGVLKRYRGKSLIINEEQITIPNEAQEHAFEQCDNLTMYCEVSSKLGKWKFKWNDLKKAKFKEN